MKKLISVIMCFLIIFSSFTFAMTDSAYADNAYVETKKNLYMPMGSTITNVIIKEDVTFIRMGSLSFFLGLNAYGKVNSENKYYRPYGSDISICVFPDSNKLLLNDAETTMPVSTFSYKNDIYVPLKFLCETMGYTVHWRDEKNAIYIQKPEITQKASEIVSKSTSAVSGKSKVKTISDNKTTMNYYGDRYAIETKGELNTDMSKNIAYSYDISNIFNEKWSQYNRVPEETYSVQKYVTANGIYTLANNKYIKDPVLPENISTMDMASKSILTDYELFLNSASVSTDQNGDYVIKSKTNVGILIKVGFDIYMPEHTSTLTWSDTYQEVTYDKDTYLPKNMTLYLSATYIPNPTDGEKMLLIYEYKYNFDFNSELQVVLPEGVS